jgi:septin family protein
MAPTPFPPPMSLEISKLRELEDDGITKRRVTDDGVPVEFVLLDLDGFGNEITDNEVFTNSETNDIV